MMSFKDFKNTKGKLITSSNDKVARPQQNSKLDQMEKQSLASFSTITSVATKQATQMETSKLYPFIGDTYRFIRRSSSGLNKNIYNIQLIETINKYKM